MGGYLGLPEFSIGQSTERGIIPVLVAADVGFTRRTRPELLVVEITSVRVDDSSGDKLSLVTAVGAGGIGHLYQHYHLSVGLTEIMGTETLPLDTPVKKMAPKIKEVNFT